MSGEPISAEQRIAADLAALGIEADEVELAVMGAMQQLLGPPIQELIETRFDGQLSEHPARFGQAPPR